MELKYLKDYEVRDFASVLIAPSGIEIVKNLLPHGSLCLVLIAPSGIEIKWDKEKNFGAVCFNRTKWN